MKFYLNYDGELKAAGNNSNRSAEKWSIRHYLHPQLVDLWNTHEALRRLRNAAMIPKDDSYLRMELHHQHPGDIDPDRVVPETHIDHTAPFEREGHIIRPLVRNSLALICDISILFLRDENPGNVIQSGDLDNRIKTLFDGLRAPKSGEFRGAPEFQGPLYCLLEDDSLISEYSIKTGRLLASPGTSKNHVRLVMEVTVKPSVAKSYNLVMVGD